MPTIKDSDAIRVVHSPPLPPPPPDPDRPPPPKGEKPKKVEGYPPEINIAKPPKPPKGQKPKPPPFDWDDFEKPPLPKPEGPEGKPPDDDKEEKEGDDKDGEKKDGEEKDGEGEKPGKEPGKEPGEEPGEEPGRRRGRATKADVDPVKRDDGKYVSDTEYFDKLSDNSGEQAYEKIIQAARQIESNTNVGPGEASDVLKITDIHDKYKKSSVSWKAELKKRVTKYINMNISKTTKKDTGWFSMNYNYITQASGGRFKAMGPAKKNIKAGMVMIYSIDVSGSIGGDLMKDILNTLNDLAIELKSKARPKKISGKVYTVQWDTEVVQGLTEFQPGMKFKVGQKTGGTDPRAGFKAVDQTVRVRKTPGGEAIEDKGGAYVMDFPEVGVPLIAPKVQQHKFSNAPLMIVVTDGEFFGELKKSDLGKVYGASQGNILWVLTDPNNTHNVYPQKEDQIIFI